MHGVQADTATTQRDKTMRRLRNVKIVATLGPASSEYGMIRDLFEAGADVFRLNMSHGEHAEIRARHEIIRRVEADVGRPIAILADLQGPKLRVGRFSAGATDLEDGQPFRLDLDDTPGESHRVQLPHKEIFEALEPGAMLLVNDGKIRLQVEECGPDFAEHAGDRRRHDLGPQGGQRARRGAGARRAEREGPQGSGIRLRARRGLAGAVVRAATP